MITDNEIFALISEAKKKIGPFKTVKEFWNKYKNLYPFPSISTIYQRFGGLNRLLQKARDWELSKETAGEIVTGKFINEKGDAIINIASHEDHFDIRVYINNQEYIWKVPKKGALT